VGEVDPDSAGVA
jgi:hypothetical protein